MKIALLHTADIHAGTFSKIFNDLDPNVELVQEIRADLLERARNNGLKAVTDDTAAALSNLTEANAVICTCSTLGPIADAFDADHVFRIDRPLMQAACETGTNILVAICLESTIASTTDLLIAVAAEMGAVISPHILLCASAWPHFESGDQQKFAKTIADAVKSHITQTPTDCVLLGQASMRVAEPFLADIGAPVLSSPVLAAQRAIEIAKERT